MNKRDRADRTKHIATLTGLKLEYREFLSNPSGTETVPIFTPGFSRMATRLPSGHRRYAACVINEQQFVRCVVLSKRRDQFTEDEFERVPHDGNQINPPVLARPAVAIPSKFGPQSPGS